jgi:hypothetical protein
MKERFSEKAEDISIVQKRLEILWSARFTDRTEVEEAVEIQERLSKKSPDGWSGAEEIRRWRTDLLVLDASVVVKQIVE